MIPRGCERRPVRGATACYHPGMSARELLVETFAHIPPAQAIAGLAAADAERRVPGVNHSIAEIVAHVTFWATWFCDRCDGTNAPMVASAATGWPPVTPGSWPDVQERFLSVLERAAAIGEDDGRLASKITPPIEFPPLAHYTDPRRHRPYRAAQRPSSRTGDRHATDDGPVAAAVRQLHVVDSRRCERDIGEAEMSADLRLVSG